MKIFLDANVLVSVLNKEYPVYAYSSRILSLNQFAGYNLLSSPICLAIAFYFSEKKSGRAEAKRKIEILNKHIEFTTVNSKTVNDALKNKKINDLEDGLEYYSATESGCKYIITEDVKDFYFSELEVYNCRTFFERVIKK